VVPSDHPLRAGETDVLEFGFAADGLANLIDDPHTDTPLTLAISAPWGAGKTSFGHMVSARLQSWPTQRGDPAHLVCWFDAWLHDDAPHLGAALAADVARTVNQHRRLADRLRHPLPVAMLTPEQRQRRVLRLGLIAMLVGTGVAFLLPDLAGMLVPEPVTGPGEDVARSLLPVAIVWALLPLWARVFAAAKSVAAFVDDPRSEAAQGTMRDVREQLHGLIAQAIGPDRRLVVLVDDLDRCTPDRALEVCEVTNQLLAAPGVVIVLLADLGILREAAKDRHEIDGPQADLGNRYLQKVVQVEFDLPVAHRDALARMLWPPPSDEATTGGLERSTDTDVTPPGSEPSSSVAVDAASPTGPSPWRHRGRIAFYLVFLAGIVANLVFDLDDAGADMTAAEEWFFTVFGFSLLLSMGVWAAGTLVDGVRRLRRRQLTRKVDEAIVAHPEATVKELQGGFSRVEGTGCPDLVVQRVARHDTTELLARIRDDSLLLARVPRNPRAAKRSWAALHLLITIALLRGIIVRSDSPNAPRTVRQLEKWVVLRQRWPAVARAVREDPPRLGRLESSSTPEDLVEELEAAHVAADSRDDLLSLLQEEPALAPVIDLLITGTGPSRDRTEASGERRTPATAAPAESRAESPAAGIATGAGGRSRAATPD
jgi:hypothetical protein